MNRPAGRCQTRRAAPCAVVRTVSAASLRGHVEAAGLHLPCALGRSGIGAIKREGDGATPWGAFDLRRVLYRADRVQRPRTGLPVNVIRPRDGWCDAPVDRNYNRAVRLPYPASAEAMWRSDGLYDVVVVLSHNEQPRRRGAGSAIFMHVARPDYAPTAGCIALSLPDLLRLLAIARPGSRIRIGP